LQRNAGIKTPDAAKIQSKPRSRRPREKSKSSSAGMV